MSDNIIYRYKKVSKKIEKEKSKIVSDSFEKLLENLNENDLIKKDTLFEIGNLYTDGNRINWESLYFKKIKKIRLPVYPFDRKIYRLQPFEKKVY